MKKSNLIGKYLLVSVFAALIFQTGCKEEGFENAKPVESLTANMTTYEYLKSKPGLYDSLIYLIDRYEMQGILSTEGVTLFAPTNTSFQIAIKNLNDARRAVGKSAVYLKDLSAGEVGTSPALRVKAKADKEHLDTMVSRYIVKGVFLAQDFANGDGRNLASVRGDYPMFGRRVYADAQGFQNGGSEVIEFFNTKRNQFLEKWSSVLTTSVNIKTKNGMVHLLRPDHVFGFDEFVLRSTVIPPPPNVFDYKNDVFFPTFQNTGHFDGQVNPGERMAKCLDGNILTKFISNFSSTTGNVTLNWIPKVPIAINAYTITSANDSKIYQGRDPHTWIVEATTAADPRSATATWVTIDSRQGQEFTTNYQRKTYDFVNSTVYTGYRVRIRQTWNIGETLVQLSEWTMNYREVL